MEYWRYYYLVKDIIEFNEERNNKQSSNQKDFNLNSYRKEANRMMKNQKINTPKLPNKFKF